MLKPVKIVILVLTHFFFLAVIEHHKDFMAYQRSFNQIIALLYSELLHKGDLL
jgi:hypothetical protein